VDWATIAISAGISAVISSSLSVLVSLATTSSITVRQARAQRRENARLALAQVAEELRLALAQYRANTRSSAQRDPKKAHSEDQRWATRILTAAADLGRIRRWLVKRRCRRIFGNFWTDMADIYPANEPAKTLGDAVGAALVVQFQQAERGEQADTTGHLLHSAYVADPGDRIQAKLDRELRLLRAAR